MRILRQNRGFTLFELMVTIGLGAALIGLAAPSISEFTRASRLAASSRDLVVDLALARNEAVMRARRVTVCTSANLTSCANSGWTEGRLVFVDGGVAGTIDGGDQVLTRTEPLDPTIETSTTGVADANFISFQPNGRLTGVGQITVCIPDEPERRVVLHRTGQAMLNRMAATC
jgi:type IV fimbrial biogenesis protein FimT